MTDWTPPGALSDDEKDHLAAVLDAASGGRAMNLEQVDGYLSALLCTPTLVSPSLYLPAVFGVDSMDEVAFDSEDQAHEAIGLLMRHHNAIAAALDRSMSSREDFHWPILIEGDDGTTRANDWARAFLRGIEWDRAAWSGLMGDEDHGGIVLPMFALAHENDPDPELRSGPYDAAKRETVIQHMVAGLAECYRYFAPQRAQLNRELTHGPRTILRESPKTGRNDPCPCGSGRKFKRCCGAAAAA